MSLQEPIQHEVQVPDIFEALGQLHYRIAEQGLEARLTHLVVLRASQLNQCGYCVKMHTEEARAAGESNDRLDRLVVWRHVEDFTDKEKAALAYTESLTVLTGVADYGQHREALGVHFSAQEISLLTSHIAMINLWNRFHVSRH